MILTSSRGTALARQRSMSANAGPLFTPSSSISNWADEMDRQDFRATTKKASSPDFSPPAAPPPISHPAAPPPASPPAALPAPSLPAGPPPSVLGAPPTAFLWPPRGMPIPPVPMPPAHPQGPGFLFSNAPPPPYPTGPSHPTALFQSPATTLALQRTLSPAERIQSGLSHIPKLPPTYVPTEIFSSFGGVPPPQTLPLPPDGVLPTGAHVVVSHDPYTVEGRMNWSLVESRTQTFMDEYETQLKDITVGYLMDKEINRFHGSVPVEKIQNILRCQHRDLYDKVVGSKHRSWNKFVEKHQDTFELFSIEDGKWRMRLTSHTNFRLGDRKEKEARETEDLHFLKALTQYLHSLPDRACKVDDFIAAYPDLPCNRLLPDHTLEHPLPKRGDFVRFVKRHSKNFAYDPSMYVIRLLPKAHGHH